MNKKPRINDSNNLDLFVSKPENLDLENWDFIGEETQYFLHKLHPYPARFIPQIPKRAISRWSEQGDTVLDPFCGSGTTLLECAFAGRNSIGVDNNEVAILVSKAKLAEYSDSDYIAISNLVDEVEKTPLDKIYAEKDRWISFAPKYPSINKWFHEASVIDLSWLRHQIQKLPEPARLLGLATFSSLIVRVSRQDSDTRYSAVDKKYKPGSTIRLWTTRTRDALERAQDTALHRKQSKHDLYIADSRQLNFIDDETVDLIVTSPPYLNTYDYHKYHRHRLHWIDGDVPFARDHEIGKHDTFTRKNAIPDPFFDDLRRCLIEWDRVLKPGARALVVIGDAIVNKQFVPVGDMLTDLGLNIGFELDQRWVRNIDTSKKSFNRGARIKREHLLLFKNKSS